MIYGSVPTSNPPGESMTLFKAIIQIILQNAAREYYSLYYTTLHEKTKIMKTLLVLSAVWSD